MTVAARDGATRRDPILILIYVCFATAAVGALLVASLAVTGHS